MKIEIVKGVYNNGKETFEKGKTLDLGDEEAKSLIVLGIARKLGGGSKQEGLDPRRRKSMESDAVQKKLGTAEEISKLSDTDLEALLKKNGG